MPRSNTKQPHTRLRAIPFLIVIAGAFLASSCKRAEGVETANAKATALLKTVAVARVTTEDLSHGLVLTAEFKPFQEIDVMAKVAGYIKRIDVDVGDRVQKGQLLATLEIPEMADDRRRASAALSRGEADVMRARDELRRAQSAHELTHLSFERLSSVAAKRPGLVAQQEIDDARGKDLVAEAQVSAAKSALDVTSEQVRMNTAELQKVQTMFEYTKVVAPFAGIVTKRYADTGSMIQAGTASQTQAMPVVRLSENSLLRLILPVPESAVPSVHIGQQVEVRVPTLQHSFPGRVARFDEKVSLSTRTMDTEVDVPNPSLLLIPGMYAEVDLTLAQHRAVLAIPVMAVDMDPSTSDKRAAASGRVMVVTPNGRVETRQVLLGIETANRIEVRSGLNEGDMVVLSGRSGLKAGDEVHPKATDLAAPEVS
jgi:RND family efflux transporter MFP subunit